MKKLYFEHLFYFFLNYESIKYFKTMNSRTSEKEAFLEMPDPDPFDEYGSKALKMIKKTDYNKTLKIDNVTGFDPLWRAE